MTFEPPDGALPKLSTTRVAGGTSARLVAAAVAGLLVGVVGLAFVNRPSPPAPAVAVVPTPAATPAPQPTPSPPRNQLEGNDGLTGWAVVAQLPFYRRSAQRAVPVYHYAASMVITGGLLRVALEAQLEDSFTGSVVIESADVGSKIQIEVGRYWSEHGFQIFESFDAWNVALKHLRRSSGGQVELLTAHVPPRLTRLGGPVPMATGYTFTVLGRRDGTRLMLLFELVWPVASQLEAYVGPRGPGLFNRCRWDVGPQAAAPRSTLDEASCPG